MDELDGMGLIACDIGENDGVIHFHPFGWFAGQMIVLDDIKVPFETSYSAN